MKPLKIVQLTDCHVAGDPTAHYRGLDARAGLEPLIQRARDWGPDLVLATGDLSEDGSEESYEWLESAFAELAVPVMAIPGNHDDPAVMRRWFATTAIDRPVIHDTDYWRLVMLNSSVPGEVPGAFDENELLALSMALQDSSLHKLIALHHQPIPVGSPWIDRYPLLRPDEFWKIVEQDPTVRIVCWGHVHQAVEFRREAICAFGSPSSASNSIAGQAQFTPDPVGPAFRWFELEPDGKFQTGILTL